MKFRFFLTVALFAVVLVFAVQNAQMVEIRLLFWTFDFPRSLLVILMLLVGAVIGWSLSSIYRISRK